MTDARDAIVREGLKAPRAGAVAGIVFSLLLLTSLVLLRSAVPEDPSEAGAWLPFASKTVSLALALLPFAGVGFLWFIGVLRDRMGPLEDRFFASVFLGSGILFLATLFVSASVASAILMTWGAMPGKVLETGIYHLGRTLVYNLINVHAMRMAAVFMVSTCTIARKLGLFPRWTALLGYALALLILLASGTLAWAPMVFPLWTLLVSVQILAANFRKTPVPSA